jgi:hypothetical protein
MQTSSKVSVYRDCVVWGDITHVTSGEVYPLHVTSNMKIAFRFAYLNTGMRFCHDKLSLHNIKKTSNISLTVVQREITLIK